MQRVAGVLDRGEVVTVDEGQVVQTGVFPVAPVETCTTRATLPLLTSKRTCRVLLTSTWLPRAIRACGTPERATFTDRVAYVWDTATGRDVAHLRGHEDYIVSCRFSPDGTKVLTASWDETARQTLEVYEKVLQQK